MAKLQGMPAREKFKHAFETVRLYQHYVLPFIERKLGYEAMHNLRSVWKAAIIPIHGADEEGAKYEQAYSNWLWQARYSHDFLADVLTRADVIAYKNVLLRLYEQELGNPRQVFLRNFRPPAVRAQALLYQMQWLTPLEITQSNGKVTCVVQECKILHAPQAKRVCRVDCRQVGAAYARSLYRLQRVTIPAECGCTITLSPLEEEALH